jgi:DNA-binding transcriptional LysR family regulator
MTVQLAAVESGSLSKASKNAFAVGTVSRKVSELEAHLTLLIRSAKGLELTPAGRSYVTAAKSILEQLNEAERAASGEYTEPKGDLVVTAPIMFGRLNVLPVVTRFLEALSGRFCRPRDDRSRSAFLGGPGRRRVAHRASSGPATFRRCRSA